MSTVGQGSWLNTYIGRKQRDDLFARIQTVRGNHWRSDDPEPPHIVRAQKAIQEWEKVCQKRREARSKKTEKPCAKAKSAVLFSKSPAEALAIVEKLEATASKNGWLKR